MEKGVGRREVEKGGDKRWRKGKKRDREGVLGEGRWRRS